MKELKWREKEDGRVASHESVPIYLNIYNLSACPQRECETWKSNPEKIVLIWCSGVVFVL